ncbi:hypothetical protein HK103_006614 [Boothiomyces macroporosus]|uniref:Secreted protein n=1 Tax=Boothiomyces macroporosus TaxID=261099 RepID=A0AAD5UHA3_9FUNG|nr:hypothetical protein HK103_006614 [Boothiomyces macroporosus]
MALLLLTISSVFAQAPTFANIQGITYAGTGCSVGSLHPYITPDRSAFHIEFHDLKAVDGNGQDTTANRKNCQLSVQLNYQQGYQFRLAAVQYTGHLSVPTGQTAIERSSYYFQGKTDTAAFESDWNGPAYYDYTVTDVVSSNPNVWSDCSNTANLEINAEVRASSNGPYTSISVNSATGFALQAYQFEWRQC